MNENENENENVPVFVYEENLRMLSVLQDSHMQTLSYWENMMDVAIKNRSRALYLLSRESISDEKEILDSIKTEMEKQNELCLASCEYLQKQEVEKNNGD